ncbi:hypothetical protein PCANB_000678 [Pneumocystis canis]|nr:hypothetical protein PCANB_000678 [Pneumocystis canis]
MDDEEGVIELGQEKSSHESVSESSKKIHIRKEKDSSDNFSVYIDDSHINEKLTQKSAEKHVNENYSSPKYEEVLDNKHDHKTHSLFSEKIDHDNHDRSSTVEHVYNEEYDEMGEHYEDEYCNENDKHYSHVFNEEALDLFDYGNLPDSLHSALTGVFSGVASRFKSILNSLKQKNDPSIQLIALQGLSELLIVSTEDVLNSYFSPDLFIKELLSIMQASGSGFYEQNPEIVLLACRCLTNLMEALPSAISNVVYGGAIPILCQKLLEIQYIDLAEQALSTLEKISTEHPIAIVRDGGLTACLTYFDFFSTNVQRTAIITAANCCKNIPSDCFAIARDVMSMLQHIIRNNDRKVLEQACLCVTRIVESFRHHPDKLEQLLSNDILEIIMSVLSNTLTNTISLSTYTQFLRVLGIAAKSSPNLSITILKLKVVETIYHILIGRFPEDDFNTQNGNIASTLYILIHRPREHIYEILNVMCELLPSLPRDDEVFSVCLTENSQLQVSSSKSAKYKMLDERRSRLLEDCQEEMKHFSRVLTPILVDIYHSTININVRQKIMIIFLKIVINLKKNILYESIKHFQFAFFLATVLSQHEYPSLILGALQLSELLLRRLSKVYLQIFAREGIIQTIYEISNFSVDEVDLKCLNSNKIISFHTSSVFTKISASDFFLILVKRAKSFISVYGKCENRLLVCEEASDIMSKLTFLAKRIKNHIKVRSTYKKLSKYFISNNSTITSYEILHSGLLLSLLDSLTNPNVEVKQSARKAFLRSFLVNNLNTDVLKDSFTSPFSVLIQKLHESLSRNEDFEVVTVHGGSHEDSRKHPSAILAKQLRLKLIAEEDSNVPRAYRNFVVSIYSVATFRTLDEYLRPRLISSQRFSISKSNNPKVSNTPMTSGAISGSTSSLIPLNKDKKMHRIKGQSFVIEKRKRSTRVNMSGQTKTDLQICNKIKNSRSDISDDEMLEYTNDYSGSDSADTSQLFQIVDTSKNEKLSTIDSDSQIGIDSPEDNKIDTKMKSKDQTEAPSGNDELKSSTSSDKKHMSYSSVLQAKEDWCIRFEMDGEAINPDSTIYSAIHRYNIQNGRESSDVWSFIYPIKFKKVLKSENNETYQEESMRNTDVTIETRDFSSYNANTILILKLLRVLYLLNTNIRDILDFDELSNFIDMTLPLSDFVNPKLTAKINRQLEEPLIVTSLCFPPWVREFPRLFLFLFPFETRWQNTNGGDDFHQSSRDDSRLLIGKLQRQKIRIFRDHILESTIKIMDLYGTSSFLLEIEYFDEVGTGLGPTLEFYSTASHEFTRKSLGLWRDDDLSGNDFVFSPNGLFPAPLDGQPKNSDDEKVMGKFIARSLLDSRIVDISINPMFFRIASGINDVKLSIESITEIDKDLANSLRFLMQFDTEKKKILNNKNISEEKKEELLKDIRIQDMSVEELSLNFTLPGFPDIHLISDDHEKLVNIYNVGEYIDLVIDFTIGKGVKRQIDAFCDGFSSVLPCSSLSLFTPEELSMLFGQSKEDWSIETLTDSIKADHGYNMDSKSIRNFLDILINMNDSERRQFLQFITGSPKLPIGGFKSLTPPLTVVCKPHEPPLTPNDYLPSVMACVNYLKLPDYTTKKIMKSKLFLAMKEGQESTPFYHEHLFLKQLALNHLLASFRFNITSSFSHLKSENSGTFLSHSRLPRSLRYIMEESRTYELHLRLTRGKWSYTHWGMPPEKGHVSGGCGIELWAYIEGDTEDVIEKRWNVLTHALSGLFCASINFMDTTKTIIPVLSFIKDKRRIETQWPGIKGYLLYGTLPQETVCTENLTPFLKLLPCKGRAGISTLLNSHRLFDAQWYSMFLDATHINNGNMSGLSNLIQGIDIVLNIERASHRDESPIPTPKPLSQIICDKKKHHIKSGSCFPLENFSDMEWSLSKLFGRPISGSCSLDFPPAEVITVSHATKRAISPKPHTVSIKKDISFSKYIISAPLFDIKVKSYISTANTEILEVPLFVERSITRKNQVNVILSNPWLTNLRIVYLENLPWFMKPFLHTLNAHVVFSNTKYSLNFEEIYFRSSIDRKRGSYFEASILVPGNSSVEITWEFEKNLLRYSEYPPDPNRGFNIAPSIITVYNTTESIDKAEPIAVIRTTSLLLTLPTPDFSMPYNVIVLTSTVIAVLFGSLFNLLIRRFVSFKEAKEKGFKLLKLRIIVFKIKTMFRK